MFNENCILLIIVKLLKEVLRNNLCASYGLITNRTSTSFDLSRQIAPYKELNCNFLINFVTSSLARVRSEMRKSTKSLKIRR